MTANTQCVSSLPSMMRTISGTMMLNTKEYNEGGNTGFMVTAPAASPSITQISSAWWARSGMDSQSEVLPQASPITIAKKLKRHFHLMHSFTEPSSPR